MPTSAASRTPRARALAAARALLEGVLSLVYPPACVACSARLPHEGALPLCPHCLAALEPADAGELAAHVGAGAPGTPLDGTLALWRYDAAGPLRPLLHGLKYGNRPRYGALLGAPLGRAWAERHAPPDALVPLPLHRARFLERGYNQSVLLADGAADVLGVPVAGSLLRRARRTETQTHFDRSARRANVDHAFASAPEAAGLRLALVDDVITTGATALAAADALRAAGAAEVWLMAVAWTR